MNNRNEAFYPSIYTSTSPIVIIEAGTTFDKPINRRSAERMMQRICNDINLGKHTDLSGCRARISHHKLGIAVTSANGESLASVSLVFITHNPIDKIVAKIVDKLEYWDNL